MYKTGSMGINLSAVGNNSNKSCIPKITQPYRIIPMKNRFLATSLYFICKRLRSSIFSDLDINGLYNANTPVEIGRHTSELQSRENLVCRLLLEKKKYD